jgi:hypothetical protein
MKVYRDNNGNLVAEWGANYESRITKRA